jgi:dTDP-4-dehydrorhamnose reductase
MKVLVTGSHGMLGTDLINLLRGKASSSASGENLKVIDAPHEELDITHEGEVLRFILRYMPDVIINCAAFTDVDRCETEREMAYRINAIGPKNIAIAAKRCGAKIVQISTDFVFDGNSNMPYVEEDMPNPLSEYGKSKLEGERNIQNNSNMYLILRTSWLFGRKGTNYVEKMIELAKKNKELFIVNNEISSPTYTVDLAEALWILIEQKYEGTFHITNEGNCSRYEWARKIFEIMGYNIKNIHPVDSSQYKRPAKVPLNSTLNCQKLTTVTGFRMRHWTKALSTYLNKQ